ncbi:hypothetical protein ACTGYU_10135 [Streptococcus suis]
MNKLTSSAIFGKEKGMDKRKEKFIETLKIMHAKIGQDFVNEKDPLTRCELAKGFMQIGDYLSKY